jgi:hypothetical protein
MRSRFARTARAHRSRRRSASDPLASRSTEARVRRKVPGLFVFHAPLAESAYAHASEACFSGFESRVGYQILLRERMRLRLLFYNLDVAKTSPPRVLADADRARGGEAGRRARKSGGHGSTAQRAALPAPRCEFDSRRLFQSFPSSKGQDRGPSSRVCRFKSGRERQQLSRGSAAASARRSGRRGRRFDSCPRDQPIPL